MIDKFINLFLNSDVPAKFKCNPALGAYKEESGRISYKEESGRLSYKEESGRLSYKEESGRLSYKEESRNKFLNLSNMSV
jgi:hypothetical protein